MWLEVTTLRYVFGLSVVASSSHEAKSPPLVIPLHKLLCSMKGLLQVTKDTLNIQEVPSVFLTL